MTPDELRALADALEPMARAPRFEDFDVPAFCAWLRAQAEAEPVAWIVEHGPTRRLTFFDEAPGKVGAGVSIPLYTHPAPAAPQAEPKRQAILGAIARAWCHPKNASKEMDVDLADAIVDEVLAINQAEPKCEPLTDERIASVCLSYRHDFGLLDDDEQARLMLEARAWERAFRKEWQRC